MWVDLTKYFLKSDESKIDFSTIPIWIPNYSTISTNDFTVFVNEYNINFTNHTVGDSHRL